MTGENVAKTAQELYSINIVRKFVRPLNQVQLDKLVNDLMQISDERQEEARQAEEQAKLEEEKIEKLYNMAKELNLSPEKMAQLFGDQNANTTKQVGLRSKNVYPPKFRYTDENGKTFTWSGHGKTAKWLMELEQQGINRDDLLIGEDGRTELERRNVM